MSPLVTFGEIRRLHKTVTVSVITEWGVYNEMLIRRAEAPQVNRGMYFTLELEEVIRVGIAETELPEEDLSGPAEGRSDEIDRGRISLDPPIAAAV